MATMQRTVSVSSTQPAHSRRIACTASRVAHSRVRLSVVAKATQDAGAVTRREVLGAALTASLATISSASPAKAFLGFGDDKKLFEDYTTETTNVLTKVKDTLALDRDDPAKEDKVKDLRKDINTWVAKYRREPKVSGRPSYGNTYSALNALAGHFNSFGAQAPIPKKRLERLVKELDDATLYLSRGR
mmetsp:Transcript_10515/g.22586  ORF Transcript_10515/g.22586 Transcript_10515/m.22586 type:complete len:188 (-) Transcript_10515:350-913(-)|eukprot:CAMPEP_0202900166 /NCGR_PEP_ID=MMETSP1392-20130828/10184_1 /ASSEMBLY_ACC=CAM_ASM_000868 /TAXON_ID=225041 /ORGANISM="Chlamydomonas chlamydogama, Strain SAG 11-48b" /LENGTH=187 /DNA_ID=CAMNT_0049586501 /DNA_START=62 /DNA_END=625 /DNA_ORIENTATION=-